jgi:hypothetical protein
MRQRQRESHALHAEEFGAGDLLLAPAVAGLGEDLFQSAHPLSLFQEQADGHFEVLQRFFFAAAAGRQVEFQSVGYEVRPSLKMRVVN